MDAPLIDPRGYADIVAQTTELAERYSDWRRPRPDGRPDAGLALISIFGRFAELVIERLNRAPDKNYLAFLNLIGVSPLPPRAARVPLTFQLAAGSPVEPVVPAGILAAAPPQAAEQDEVVFETERLLVLTRSGLKAVFVSDTMNDTYSDRGTQATGETDQPFLVFTGDRPSPHELYLACDPLLTEPGAKELTLTLASPDIWPWQNWPVSWALQDGDDWRTVTSIARVADGAWRVTLPALPALIRSEVNNVAAGWLRARLDMPLPPGRSGLIPESAAVGVQNPQDLTLPLSPFPADNTVRRFYLSADEAFAVADGSHRATLHLRLARPGAGAGLQLSWFYQTQSQWLPLDAASADFRDGTEAFTKDGDISFHLPVSWPRTPYRTRIGRWLRVDIGGGHYTTSPMIAALTMDCDWLLPRLGAITVSSQAGAPVSPQPPSAAFCNDTGLDLTKDFYPLGQQPQFNDTFYVACPRALAIPGAIVTLTVTLTNPAGDKTSPVPPVRTADNPKIAWEVSDSGQWRAIAVTYELTESGKVSVTLPDPLTETTVNGTPGYWIRARLAGGSYGTAASYEQKDGTYIYKPATFAPPVIKTLTVTATAPERPDTPVTACMSYNDFAYTDQIADARRGGLFPPFTPTADTRPALYLGFDKPFSQRPVTLFLDVEPPLPAQVTAGLLAGADLAATALTTWEYASQDGWQPLGAADQTLALTSRDTVTFIGPADLVRRACFGQRLSWLRLRWQAGTFPLPPELRRVLPNTTWAAQVTTVAEEILGSGNGEPGQSFRTARAPVQPGQQVTVREPQRPAPAEEQALTGLGGEDAVAAILDASGQPEEIWVRWHAVTDFYESGPRDRHYTVDPLSGVIRFGDGSYGMIPPAGQSNIRVTYRTGGGEQGNRDTGTVVELKSSIPYVDGVSNNQPSQGGAPVEQIERVKARGPRILRHRDRAVAAQDLEDLALAASADVATAAAIVPIFNPYGLWLNPEDPRPTPEHAAVQAGRMGVIIVPDEPGSARPVPSLALLSQVREYLTERCPPTASLRVAGPEWISVAVDVTVVVTSAQDADPVANRVRTALAGYLRPLTGGPSGLGCPLGGRPHASDLSALLEAVDGVDHVRSLSVSFDPQTTDEALKLRLLAILRRPMTVPGPPPEREREELTWLDRALIFSGQHHITVALPEQASRP